MWQNPARNIEIKARINDVKAVVNKVAELCKTEAEVIDQTDMFFKTENGRLKLREFKVVIFILSYVLSKWNLNKMYYSIFRMALENLYIMRDLILMDQNYQTIRNQW